MNDQELIMEAYKSIFVEHQADEQKDQQLKETFASILEKKEDTQTTVAELFDAVQKHLKESGQQ